MFTLYKLIFLDSLYMLIKQNHLKSRWSGFYEEVDDAVILQQLIQSYLKNVYSLEIDFFSIHFFC